jgi:hypothetical protein
VKLRELKEDFTDDEVMADAKAKFIKKLNTELQQVLASPNITQVTTPSAASTQGTTPAPVSTTPNVPQQAAQTRQQRQQSAAQTAQSQMAQNTATPTSNVAQQAAQTRQQRQQSAAQAAQTQMAQNPVKPKVWKSGRKPNEPARRNAVANENRRFERLNALFESIINVDETTPAQATAPLSMSDVITTNFVKLMNAPHVFGPNNTDTLPTIQKFAKEIADTYPVDGGKKAIDELGNWAWDTLSELKRKRVASKWGISPSGSASQQQSAATATTQQATTPQQAATTQQSVTSPNATSTQQATGQSGETAAPAEVQQSKVGVRQINKLIPTLRKRDLLSVKKNVDNTLAGKSSTEPASAEAPANAGANAFGQMAGQLSGSNKSKSSTGGTTTKTPTGIVHTAKPQQQQPAATAPEKDNIISMPKRKTGKVRAAREGGVTPEEQAKFDEKVRQAMASQKT